jgi:N-formylglutamate amidohydrolase
MCFARFDFSASSPIIGTAIHNGHIVDDIYLSEMKISDRDRLYEEDPFTERFIEDFANTIIVNTSRFEVDLNRTLEKCLYQTPEDSWGLDVWKNKCPDKLVTLSQNKHQVFYQNVFEHLRELSPKFGKIFVWDVHSYNSRAIDDSYLSAEPDIMIGLSNMHPRWFALIEKICIAFRDFDFLGRNLSVTTQGKYSGGNFSRWIHNTFPDSAVCIALEFKKIFMDQESFELDIQKTKRLSEMLISVNDLIINELNKY